MVMGMYEVLRRAAAHFCREDSCGLGTLVKTKRAKLNRATFLNVVSFERRGLYEVYVSALNSLGVSGGFSYAADCDRFKLHCSVGND